MKTSRLVLAPAVAVALTGLAGAPAFAATESAPVPAGPLCAYDDAQQSTDPDSKVPDSSDPQATLSAAQVTRADIADRKKGIGFSGTGFTPDNKATVTVVGTDGSKYSPETKLTVDEKGKVSGTYFFSVTDNAKVPCGQLLALPHRREDREGLLESLLRGRAYCQGSSTKMPRAPIAPLQPDRPQRHPRPRPRSRLNRYLDSD